VVGIDGGGLDDLLGLAVIGREKDTGRWLHWGHAWAHEIALKRRMEIAPRLRDFERDGDLTIVARPGEDVTQVADIVCKLLEAGMLPESKAIGVDAAGIGDIVDELSARDVPEGMLVAVSQGWRLNGAIKTSERKVAGGELVHGDAGLMAWCVSNARVEDKGNAISTKQASGKAKITKQASGKAKIDPLMALFDAVSLMALVEFPALTRFGIIRGPSYNGFFRAADTAPDARESALGLVDGDSRTASREVCTQTA
jgi:phage terminase large subunit-like protein